MFSRMSLNALSRAVPKSYSLTKNCSSNRSLHLICRNRIIIVSNISNCRIVPGQSFIRHASTIDTFQIPAPPTVPIIIEEPQLIVESASELANAGLGTSWTPVSLVQHILEFLHVSAGLPWWATIVFVTITVRLACFPLIIQAQRNMAEMATTYMPKVHEVNDRMKKARLNGDRLAVEECTRELIDLQKNRKFFLFPSILQGGIAFSIFLSLNKMTAAPLPSMQEGGLSWFTNLCIPDPYYILPMTSSTTLFLLLVHSSDMLPLPKTAKNVFIVMAPLSALYFMKGFAAGTLIYWVTTNSVTLTQHLFLKVPAVRKYFDLKTVPPPSQTFSQAPGFFKQFSEGMDNAKVAQQYKERFSLQDLEKRRTEIIELKKGLKNNNIETTTATVLAKKR